MTEEKLRATLAPKLVAEDATICCQNGNRLPCGRLMVYTDPMHVLMMFDGCSPITCGEKSSWCSRFRQKDGSIGWEEEDVKKGEVKDCYKLPENEHEEIEVWDMAISDAILEEGGALFEPIGEEQRREQFMEHHQNAVKKFEKWDILHPEFGKEHADDYEVYRRKYRK